MARKTKRKGKKRAHKTKAGHHKKGHIPLPILEKRLTKLSRIVHARQRRGG